MANLLTGLDKLIADIAGPLVFSAGRLARQTRVSDGRGGWSTADTYEACQTLVQDYSAFSRTSLGIPNTDRKVLVLGHGLTAPPIPGNVFVIDGYRWVVVETTRDPAKAVYECQCRPDGMDRVIARSVMSIANPVLAALGKLRIAASGAMTIANPLLTSASRVAIAAAAAIVIASPVLDASATAFSPDQLFAASETGAVYDPSDLTSLYQSRTGGANVTAGGQTVGVMLDKSRMGGKSAAEFISEQPTIAHTSASASPDGGGVYTLAASQSIRFSFPLASLTNGRWYEIEIEVLTRSGTTSSDLCGTASASITTTGTIKYLARRDTYDSTFRFVDVVTGAASAMTFRAPVLREIPGFHAIAPSDAARPLCGREPVTGRRNLLINTPFAGAVAGTPGTAPTSWNRVLNGGTLTPSSGALRVQTTSARDILSQSYTVAANTTYTYSIAADINLTHGVQAYVSVANLPAGATIQSYTLDGVDVAGSAQTGTGLKRLGVRYRINATTGSPVHYFGGGVSGSGTCDATFSEPQLEIGSAFSGYQTAVSALDVTEAGVASRHFLQPDGVDDWMRVLPVCNLGETWAHVGGWNAFDQSDWFFTTSSDGGNGGAFLANGARLCWRNSAIVNTRIGTDFDLRNVPSVCTIEQGSTASLSGRVNGAAGVTITPANDSAATQGLALFSLTNSAASNGLSGRYFGGTWINRAITPTERAALERWQTIRTLAA